MEHNTTENTSKNPHPSPLGDHFKITLLFLNKFSSSLPLGLPLQPHDNSALTTIGTGNTLATVGTGNTPATICMGIALATLGTGSTLTTIGMDSNLATNVTRRTLAAI